MAPPVGISNLHWRWVYNLKFLAADETFKTLNLLMKVQILTQNIKPDDTYGKALLHKMDENRTMLYCELPDLMNQ